MFPKSSCMLGLAIVLILVPKPFSENFFASGGSPRYELLTELSRKTIQDISTERRWVRPETGVVQLYGEKYGSAFLATSYKEVFYEDSAGGRSKKMPEMAGIEVYADSSQAELVFNEFTNIGGGPDVSLEMLGEFEFHGMKARKAVAIVKNLVVQRL